MSQKDIIEIYTLGYCVYCKKALEFFNEHNLDFVHYPIDNDEEKMFDMLARKYDIAGDVTVPQIILNNKRIGGYSDMMELYEKGKIFQ